MSKIYLLYRYSIVGSLTSKYYNNIRVVCIKNVRCDLINVFRSRQVVPTQNTQSTRGLVSI